MNLCRPVFGGSKNLGDDARQAPTLPAKPALGQAEQDPQGAPPDWGARYAPSARRSRTVSRDGQGPSIGIAEDRPNKCPRRRPCRETTTAPAPQRTEVRGPQIAMDIGSYLTSTLPPASSSLAFALAASSLLTFSRTGFGAPSTRSLASFRPRLVSSRTTLMT